MRTVIIKFGFIFLIAALLSSCAVPRPNPSQAPKIHTAGNQWVQLPQPAALALNISATQILTANAKGKTYTTQVAAEVTPKRITLVALGGWGGRLFSINYDGKTISSKSLPIKNAGIGIQQTLADFIFTYAPPSVLTQMLATTNIKLTLQPQQRIFSIHGKPVIKIHYQYTNPWKGNVVLQNFSKHYTIHITTITVRQNP